MHAAEVEPVVVYDHTSDMFRGKPWNEQEAPQADYVGAGVMLTLGKRRATQIDITHGRLMLDHSGKFESASKLSVRFLPGRLR